MHSASSNPTILQSVQLTILTHWFMKLNRLIEGDTATSCAVSPSISMLSFMNLSCHSESLKTNADLRLPNVPQLSLSLVCVMKCI